MKTVRTVFFIGAVLLFSTQKSLAEKPQRIVSLSLCIDQLLLMMVNKERIAALSHLAPDKMYSYMWEASKGITIHHNQAEEIVPLNPDLIITTTFTSGNTLQMLKRLGHNVLVVPTPTTFSEAKQLTRTIGKAVNELERAESIIQELQNDLTTARQLAAGKPSLSAISYGPNGFTAGKNTMKNEILHAAGYSNLAAELGIEYFGNIALEQLVISNPDIERIEVLRGPQGMMYGADAGGIINIITKKADKPLQGGINIDAGRYNSEQLAGNLRGKMGSFDYSLAISDLSTDGFNARTNDRQGDNDGYDNTTIGLSVGFDISEAFRLQLLARDVDGDSEFDNCYDGTFSVSHICDNEFEQQNYKVDAIFNSSDNWKHQLSYGIAKTERISITDKSYLSFDIDGEVEQLQYLGTLSLNPSAQLVYGVDLQEDSIENAGKASERDQAGIYLEWQGGISDSFFYTAGIRHDDNDDFGENSSYRLTSAYLIPLGDNEIKLKASHSTGFRAPSLFEIAYNASNLDPNVNKTLDQETSKGFDLGVEFHTLTGAFFEAVYFNQDVEDEISYEGATNSYTQLDGRSESKGVELSFEQPLAQTISLNGNYTYNDTQDSSNQQRVRRPRHIVNVGLSAVLLNDQLSINANLRHVTDAVDRVFIGFSEVRVDLDDYEVLDLNIAYDITPELAIYLRGENVLNEEYQETSNFNTSRAATYAGFRYRF